MYAYEGPKLIDIHFDMSFDDIRKIAAELKVKNKDAEIEITCTGEDCMGGFHRWSIDD